MPAPPAIDSAVRALTDAGASSEAHGLLVWWESEGAPLGALYQEVGASAELRRRVELQLEASAALLGKAVQEEQREHAQRQWLQENWKTVAVGVAGAISAAVTGAGAMWVGGG